MAFVLDCSVTMTWMFRDEATETTDALRGRLLYESAIVPALWTMEVANALLVAKRRGRIQPDELNSLTGLLRDLPVEIDSLDMDRVVVRGLDLANQYSLSVYDAMYLELAIRRGLPLATLDRRLTAACRDAGVRLCL